jgi:RNA-directed DNA polymerase
MWQISQAQVDVAYQWLCAQRKHYPPNADVWHFRIHWPQQQARLIKQLEAGEYVFSPMQQIKTANGKTIHLWGAQDALVLKIMALQLQDCLSLSPACTHVKGHGGLKHAVVQTQQQLTSTVIKDYHYVCKTDVKHFYETIDQGLLIDQLYAQVTNKALRRYCYQVICRTVEVGGNYRTITTGISRGCPISPLLGALYLKSLDDAFTNHKSDWFYIRYMDDILILSQTRWQNRKAVKLLNAIFNKLKVTQHPDKTFIGKLSKGFDFLGYHFSPKGLSLANITIKKHVERYRQLYVPAGGIPNLAKC